MAIPPPPRWSGCVPTDAATPGSSSSRNNPIHKQEPGTGDGDWLSRPAASMRGKREGDEGGGWSVKRRVVCGSEATRVRLGDPGVRRGEQNQTSASLAASSSTPPPPLQPDSHNPIIQSRQASQINGRPDSCAF